MESLKNNLIIVLLLLFINLKNIYASSDEGGPSEIQYPGLSDQESDNRRDLVRSNRQVEREIREKIATCKAVVKRAFNNCEEFSDCFTYAYEKKKIVDVQRTYAKNYFHFMSTAANIDEVEKPSEFCHRITQSESDRERCISELQAANYLEEYKDLVLFNALCCKIDSDYRFESFAGFYYFSIKANTDITGPQCHSVTRWCTDTVRSAMRSRRRQR